MRRASGAAWVLLGCRLGAAVAWQSRHVHVRAMCYGELQEHLDTNTSTGAIFLYQPPSVLNIPEAYIPSLYLRRNTPAPPEWPQLYPQRRSWPRRHPTHPRLALRSAYRSSTTRRNSRMLLALGCYSSLNLPLSAELTPQIERWGLRDAGFNYNIVSVFGSQSTGKSAFAESQPCIRCSMIPKVPY